MAHLAALSPVVDRWSRSLHERSLMIPPFLHRHMVLIAAAWIALAGGAALLRMAVPAAPAHHAWDALPMLVVYSAIIVAPLSGFMLARAAFADDRAQAPLDFHLSFVGKWRRLSPDEARSHPMFGPVGFLASLLVGLMLNVVVRTGEFFVAVPAMSAHAPDWALTLFFVMAADVVVMNFFYMAAFVMALRSVPLFPRMLLFVWLIDILMQFVIAGQIARLDTLPLTVVEPLVTLLEGNVTKVLISIAIWVPYLLLSKRANLTYRWRLPA